MNGMPIISTNIKQSNIIDNKIHISPYEIVNEILSLKKSIYGIKKHIYIKTCTLHSLNITA